MSTTRDAGSLPGITRASVRQIAPSSVVGRWLELLFCYFAVSVFMGAYTPIPLRLAGTSQMAGDSNPLNFACNVVILFVLTALCALRWRRVLFVALQGKAVLLFIVLAALSIAWSQAPDLTLRRVVTLSGTVIFAWYACASFPIEWTIRLIAKSILVSGVASAIVAIALPAVGVMTEADLAGAWCGVYSHKNPLGWMMILGSLSYGWLWVRSPGRRVRYGVYIVFFFGLAVMSRSRSAEVMIVLLPFIGFATGIVRLGGLARLWAIYLLIAGLAAAGVAGALFFADVMAMLGKDPSLTGRVPLWLFLLDDIKQQPLLGYGFGAYFLDGTARQQWSTRLINWYAPEAHNGYLEVTLQLGIPGFLLVLWLLVSTARLALSRPLRDELPWAGFAAVYAISTLIVNLIDTMVMNPGTIHSVVLPMLYIGLRTELVERRVAAQKARPTAACAV